MGCCPEVKEYQMAFLFALQTQSAQRYMYWNDIALNIANAWFTNKYKRPDEGHFIFTRCNTNSNAHLMALSCCHVPLLSIELLQGRPIACCHKPSWSTSVTWLLTLLRANWRMAMRNCGNCPACCPSQTTCCQTWVDVRFAGQSKSRHQNPEHCLTWCYILECSSGRRRRFSRLLPRLETV